MAFLKFSCATNIPMESNCLDHIIVGCTPLVCSWSSHNQEAHSPVVEVVEARAAENCQRPYRKGNTHPPAFAVSSVI